MLELCVRAGLHLTPQAIIQNDAPDVELPDRKENCGIEMIIGIGRRVIKISGVDDGHRSLSRHNCRIELTDNEHSQQCDNEYSPARSSGYVDEVFHECLYDVKTACACRADSKRRHDSSNACQSFSAIILN